MNPTQPTIPTSNFGRVGLGSFSADQNSLGDSLKYYRDMIQFGQLAPKEASSNLFGDYVNSIRQSAQASGAPGYSYGGDQWKGIESQLFSPMKILQNPSQNMQNRQGNLKGNGDVLYDSPYSYKSVTTGAGSTGSGKSLSGQTNEQWIGRPVAPYSGPAPKLSSLAIPNLY